MLCAAHNELKRQKQRQKQEASRHVDKGLRKGKGCRDASSTSAAKLGVVPVGTGNAPYRQRALCRNF